MKYIKKFESNREQLLSDATSYIEEGIGVTTTDGLMSVYHSDNYWSKFVTIKLIFNSWTKKENYHKVYKFLKYNNLEILRELMMTDIYEIDIKISEYKIKKFAILYNATNKYNL